MAKTTIQPKLSSVKKPSLTLADVEIEIVVRESQPAKKAVA
jgi:hypothetical protein